MIDLHNHSLDDVARLVRQGRATRADATEYIKKWNQGPHFTQACMLDNGNIMQVLPDESLNWGSDFWRRNRQEFAMKIPFTGYEQLQLEL